MKPIKQVKWQLGFPGMSGRWQARYGACGAYEPEIIVFQRVVGFQLPVNANCRGQACFIPPAAQKPVYGHQPAKGIAVFGNGLTAVFGA